VKYMAERRRPLSQGWKDLPLQSRGRNRTDRRVRHSDDFISAIVWTSGPLALATGALVAGCVTARPSAEWVARQFTEACSWSEPPRSIIRDRDSAVRMHLSLEEGRADSARRPEGRARARLGNLGWASPSVRRVRNIRQGRRRFEGGDDRTPNSAGPSLKHCWIWAPTAAFVPRQYAAVAAIGFDASAAAGRHSAVKGCGPTDRAPSGTPIGQATKSLALVARTPPAYPNSLTA
jgi:hypothetical protein